MTTITIPAPFEAPPQAKSLKLAAGWEVLIVFLISTMAAFLNDKLCLLTLGGGSIVLILRHQESPASVIGIVFAIACQAPFLRRVHDLLHGFSPGSVILISTYTAFPALGYVILKDLGRLRESIFLPMVLAGAGVLWAYCVGAAAVGILPASIQLLQYGAGPIVFAYLVLRAEALDHTILTRWFLVLGLIEAVYGLYQWVSPPPWDVAWFTAVKMEVAGGLPLPFMMRTFGTLNITSPYSYFAAFCLSVTVLTRGYIWTAPLLIAALATTQARSSWGCLALAWMVTFLLARGKVRTRFATTVAVTLLLVGLLASPFSDRLVSLTARFSTVTNLKGDGSFNDRSRLVEAALSGGALENPLGVGLGNSGSAVRTGASSSGIDGIDNGFLQTVWLFGWFGSFVYLGGLFLALGRGLFHLRRLGPYEIQFLAAVIALFAANLFESSLDDIKGVMVWASLGVVNVGAMRWRPKS